MTNASTLVTTLRGIETRTMRSSVNQSKKNENPDETRLGVSLSDPKHAAETDLIGEEAALTCAEEDLMLEDDEDEEISSHDEDGNPIVDTDKLENRMLTVAIVKSVVETGGETQSHRYGLRKRRRPSECSPRSPDGGGGRSTRSPRSTVVEGRHDGPDSTRLSPGPSPRTTRSTVKVKKEEEKDVSSAVPPSTSATPALKPQISAPQPVVAKAKPVVVPKLKAPVVKVEQPTPAATMKCMNVPNPLANSTPVLEARPVVAATLKREVDSRQQGSSETQNPLAPVRPQQVSSTSMLPSVPPPVACPLSSVPSKDHAKPEQVVSATSASTSQRGRIFSIDIDPAGLDFPDLGIVGAINQQSELSKAAPLPPMSATSSGGAEVVVSNTNVSQQQPKQQVLQVAKHPAAPSGDLLIVGRDRAMSFEFFSFGLNHDEPLPPAPDLSASATESLARPRGDSIIFDPCSFRDGGVIEENGLLKSRGNSLDITLNEEAAIMNEPGFAPASTSLVETQTHSTTQVHAPRSHHTTSTSTSVNSSYILPAQNTSSQIATSILNNKNTQPTLTKSPSSAQMATLPSSLSGSSMTHATFQMELLNKDGRIGIYLPEARKERIAKFHSKRKMRIWRKRIKYDCRKKLADSRPRIKGRFVKRSDMEEDED